MGNDQGRRTALLAFALLIAMGLPGAAAPAADAPASSLLGVNVSRGHVQLLMLAPTGAQVTFSEEVDGARADLGTSTAVPPAAGGPDGAAPVPSAIPWRCDRTVRRFHAVARAKDGRTIEATNEARTPNCKDRVAVAAPKRVEPGEKFAITLRDRWQLGDLPVRVCLVRKGSRRCEKLAFAPGERSLSFTRSAGPGVGLLDIDVLVAREHVHHKVGVGRPAPRSARPVLLVTGDSMMQGIDAILAERLKKQYRVVRQTRPGTGVSKELGKAWPVLAREQAKKHTPAVTVVLLGGNDGFTMDTANGTKVKCCGEPWRAEYLARLQDMATAYARGGRARVVWSLLPPTKREDLRAPLGAVNDAIGRLAAAGPSVELVPLDERFGPGYRDQIDGRKVRDPDGLHFSLDGQHLAAKAILAVLRKAAPAAAVTTP